MQCDLVLGGGDSFISCTLLLVNLRPISITRLFHIEMCKVPLGSYKFLHLQILNRA